MTSRLPCAEGNSDDWFVGRDGKQYPDEELLSNADRQEVADAALAEHGDGDGIFEAVEKAVDRAEADAKRAALRRRRNARAACHTDCLLRTQCLDKALREGHQHGTWGGYYEEELRAIRLEIERRNGA